jgi:signal peptide peptidase SppA
MLSVNVPGFHRLDEYAGAWAIHGPSAAKLWTSWSHADLRAHVMNTAPKPNAAAMTLIPSQQANKSVAVIPVAGLLMKQASSLGGTSTVAIRREVRAAAADPSITGILLAIDSPGGTVSGTQALAEDVKAAAKRKPVWAQVEDLGASAAYWIASQCDAIYAANGTTLVGSIGTIITVYDSSEASAKDGVRTLVFRTGPLKGAGGIEGDPFTEEQGSAAQALVESMQIQFDQAVKTGRGLTTSQLTAVKSGAIYVAADALDRRLIDGIRSMDKTIAALQAAK